MTYQRRRDRKYVLDASKVQHTGMSNYTIMYLEKPQMLCVFSLLGEENEEAKEAASNRGNTL